MMDPTEFWGRAPPDTHLLIVSIAYLINADIRVQEVLQSIHPHPSVTEGIQSVRVFYDQSILTAGISNLIRVLNGNLNHYNYRLQIKN